MDPFWQGGLHGLSDAMFWRGWRPPKPADYNGMEYVRGYRAAYFGMRPFRVLAWILIVAAILAPIIMPYLDQITQYLDLDKLGF